METTVSSKTTIAQKKEQILALVASGAKRPAAKTDLGYAVANYTNVKNGSYDAEFTAKLPTSWFRAKKAKVEAETTEG